MPLKFKFKRGRAAWDKTNFSKRTSFRKRQKDIEPIEKGLLETYNYEYIHSNVNTFQNSYLNLIDEIDPAIAIMNKMADLISASNVLLIKEVKSLTETAESNLGIDKTFFTKILKNDITFSKLIKIRDDIRALGSSKFKNVSKEEKLKTLEKYKKQSDLLISSISGLTGERSFYTKSLTIASELESVTKSVNINAPATAEKKFEKWMGDLFRAEGVFLELGVEHAFDNLIDGLVPKNLTITKQGASGSSNVLHDWSGVFTNIDSNYLINLGLNLKLADTKYGGANRSIDTKSFWDSNTEIIRGLQIAEYCYWNYRALSNWRTLKRASVKNVVADQIDLITRTLEDLYKSALLFSVMVMHQGKKEGDELVAEDFNNPSVLLDRYKEYLKNNGVATLYVKLGKSEVLTTWELFEKMNTAYLNHTGEDNVFYPKGSVSSSKLIQLYGRKRFMIKQNEKENRGITYNELISNSFIQESIVDITSKNYHFLIGERKFTYQFMV